MAFHALSLFAREWATRGETFWYCLQESMACRRLKTQNYLHATWDYPLRGGIVELDFGKQHRIYIYIYIYIYKPCQRIDRIDRTFLWILAHELMSWIEKENHLSCKSPDANFESRRACAFFGQIYQNLSLASYIQDVVKSKQTSESRCLILHRSATLPYPLRAL